jgi:hypothetical protein
MPNEKKVKVVEVKRENNRVIRVVIDSGPFRMNFVQKHKKTSLIGFQRFDDSKDEFHWIPGYYFKPAIRVARAIFAESRKQGQARLF